jgi:hypothetical protein
MTDTMETMLGIKHTGQMHNGKPHRGGIGFASWNCDGTPRPELEKRYGKHFTLKAGESVAVPGDWLAAAMEKGVFGSHVENGPLELVPAEEAHLETYRMVTVRNETTEPMLGHRFPAGASVQVPASEVKSMLHTDARRLFEDGSLTVEVEGGWRALERPGAKAHRNTSTATTAG